MNGSMGSGCENRAADRKFDWRCCSGLLVVGENVPRPVLVEPGMFTGAELPSRPDDASPTDIELLTLGESDSKSRSNVAARFKVSSKCKSSNALPENNNNNINTKRLHNLNDTICCCVNV